MLNGHNGYQPPAQRLAAWLVGYVPANGPTVRWGQTPRVGICPPLWVGQPPAAPRSFRQLPVQTGSQRLANPTILDLPRRAPSEWHRRELTASVIRIVIQQQRNTSLIRSIVNQHRSLRTYTSSQQQSMGEELVRTEVKRERQPQTSRSPNQQQHAPGRHLCDTCKR